MMEAEPGLMQAIVGTGVALAALNMIRMGMQLPHPSDAPPDPAHEKYRPV